MSLQETRYDAPPLPFSGEVKRKALHMLAIVMPIGIVLVPSPLDWILLGLLALFAVAADFARVRVPAVKVAVERIFAPTMRPNELQPIGGNVVINGATWMCISAALCAFLFPAAVAASALALLMIGDAAAALVGMRFGRHRYPWSSKTIEGSLAFVVTGILAAMPFALLVPPGVSPGAVIIAAVAGAAVEAAPLPVNDNVKVALVAGAIMLVFA
jgi:dolichol kinase